MKTKKTKLLMLAMLGMESVLLISLAGCEGTVVAEDRGYHHHHAEAVVYAQPAPVVVAPAAAPAPPPPPPPAVVYAPPPAPPPPAPVVVAQPAPTFVEEGAVVNGVVVTPYASSDYVLINGGWYYWHPGIHRWVHAHRPIGWHPAGHVHVYHSWAEHPMYRR